MALISCPECGQSVSENAVSCPHCGYELVEIDKAEKKSAKTGYDVMLVDYNKNSLSVCRSLEAVLNISYSEAKNLLRNLPAYLYTDIEKEDAEYLARNLQKRGMRIAVYTPDSEVFFYSPANYNIAMPILTPVVRRPWFYRLPPRGSYFSSVPLARPRIVSSRPRTVTMRGPSMFSPMRSPMSSMGFGNRGGFSSRSSYGGSKGMSGGRGPGGRR